MRELDFDPIELPEEALDVVAGGHGSCIDPLG